MWSSRQRYRYPLFGRQEANGNANKVDAVGSALQKNPGLAGGLEAIDDERSFEPELGGGELPEVCRLGRCLGSTRLDKALLFADLASAEAFQILTEELAPVLAGIGQVFSGVRYLSRLNPEWELWAVFHDRMVHSPDELSKTVRADDPGLTEAASVLGIEIG